ncbi:hypothetical protein E1265_07900 [Streptomyces sp. 8K308]|uniref:hypothetical protein n=1 Tax=Streptomyces sp. 8K308 TaxID=2530388 RepID=UPI001050ACEA|nr:hypothetical protein [Streptomyces sp. 8K308]TDC25084.1 hypothetical protein E1265_07900 [Streptomyces sp. 8K308]
MSDTRRGLLGRLALLLALTCVAVAALFTAYAGVHRDAGAVRHGTAPAILDITTAQDALRLANAAAREALESGQGTLVGAGSGYRIQLAVANQSLAGAAEGDVAGDAGLRVLQTVSGLIVAYSGWIERAAAASQDPDLRGAYLHYADTMLNREDSGILARLDRLQTEQRAELATQTVFGWPERLTWAAALLTSAALVDRLRETQRFLRRRFRRRHNPWLFGATLALLAACALLALGTVQTQCAKDESRGDLAETVDIWQSVAGGEAAGRQEDVARSIRGTAEEVETEMRDTGWRVGLTGWVPALAPALATLIVCGMAPRIAEYRFRVR